MSAWLAALLAMAVVTGCTSARTPAARMLPAEREAEVVYVALGDSTVEGVGASSPSANYVSRLHERLRTRYPNARVLNLGVGGATSADVIAEQLAPALAGQPHLVTLSIGPNDVTAGVPVDVYARNVDTILGRLATDTRAVVVVNLLPDLAITPRFRGRQEAALVGRLSVDFNSALTKASRRHGVALVDLHAASRREVPSRPELIARDGYHPSDLGYARWAELMWQAVQGRIRS